MHTSWQFHAVRADNAFGFKWYWQRRYADGSSSQTEMPFDYYYDCIEDARRHGYRGPLPAGPQVALLRLPTLSRARSKAAGVRRISVKEPHRSRKSAPSQHA